MPQPNKDTARGRGAAARSGAAVAGLLAALAAGAVAAAPLCSQQSALCLAQAAAGYDICLQVCAEGGGPASSCRNRCASSYRTARAACAFELRRCEALPTRPPRPGEMNRVSQSAKAGERAPR